MDKIKEILSNPMYAAIALIGALAVVGTVLWLVLGGTDEEETPVEENGETDYSASVEDDEETDDGDYALSGDDVVQIEENVSTIISTVGNFGTHRSVLEGEFIPEEDINEETYTSREGSYLSVRDMITDNSTYYYSDSRAEGWEEEEDSLGFEVNSDSIFISDIEGPTTVVRDGTEYDAVDVTVSWEGDVFYYEVTATDTSWDGSFEVMEMNYEETDAVFRMVNTESGWKLSSTEDFGNEQFTALWSSPDQGRILGMSDFENIGSTEATMEPFDESTLPPEPEPTPSDNPLDDQVESDIDDDFRDRMYSPPIDTGNDEED